MTAFERALRERLKARAIAMGQTLKAVLAPLADARRTILDILGSQPTDWQRWHLRRISDQIAVVLDTSERQQGIALESGLREQWKHGEDAVDKPLAAAGSNVELVLGDLPIEELAILNQFTRGRLKDVAVTTERAIDREIGLVIMGAQTPDAAIRKASDLLGSNAAVRAGTIVKTSTHQAFAISSFKRLQQAAAIVPGLKKQWIRSGKVHSRWNHDLIDGQVQDVGDTFFVPAEKGGLDEMMHPHDPKAPAGQVINCGCMCVAWNAAWTSMTNKTGRPFTAEEKRRDPDKAATAHMRSKLGRG